MDKKKIVFITSNLSQTGGLQMVTANLANEFAKKYKYNIDIINLGIKYGDEKYELNPNINVKYVGIDNSNCKNKFDLIKNLINSYIRLKNYIKLNCKNKNQVIIGMGTGVSYLLPYIYNKKNNTIIGTQHTKIDMEINCKLKDIKIIPNPLTIKVDEKSKLDSKIVLAVGRLTKQKGFDLLLESWKIVSSKHNDWNLVIVGEGEEYESLNNKIKNIGIEESVSIKPFTRDIQQYYKNSSIFVLSSRYEGFGLVVLEAQAFGIPVVAFNCPTGPRNIINDGIDGYLVEAENIDKLAKQIIMLIKDKNIRTKVGENAIKNIEKFKIENIMKQWNSLIIDLIEINTN